MMANSWGFDNSQYYPPLMSAWSKYVLGWVSPTIVSSSGTYSIGQACDNNDMIIISEGYPSGEYLLIENRQPCGFETSMPQGGLAIFHIDDEANNIVGHPQQTGWPTNGNHYEVALLQADATYGLELNYNRGDSGDLFHAGGVNSIGPDGTSAGATFPNTKAYQGGNIIDTEVTISNISAAGATMTFDVTIGSTVAASTTPSASPSASPVSTPVTECENFPNQFIVNVKENKTRKKTCNKTNLCTLNGVAQTCPLLCGTCGTCEDSPLKFITFFKGSTKKKTCLWVAENPAKRCELSPDIKLACRSTCNQC